MFYLLIRGGKQFGSLTQILHEALRDKIVIPMLLIEVDVGDARFVSYKVIKEKVIKEKIKICSQILLKLSL